MPDLVPYNEGGELASRDVRRVGRSISQARATSELRIARSFAAEQVSLAKLDILSSASAAAATHASRLAKLTVALEMECPEAAESLRAIRNGHTHLVLTELSQLERALRYR